MNEDIKDKLTYVDKYIAENSCDDLVVAYFVDILNYIYELENKFSKQRNLYKEIQADIINLQKRIDKAIEYNYIVSNSDYVYSQDEVANKNISILKGEDKEC